jgi:hypothetical protein
MRTKKDEKSSPRVGRGLQGKAMFPTGVVFRWGETPDAKQEPSAQPERNAILDALQEQAETQDALPEQNATQDVQPEPAGTQSARRVPHGIQPDVLQYAPLEQDVMPDVLPNAPPEQDAMPALPQDVRHRHYARPDALRRRDYRRQADYAPERPSAGLRLPFQAVHGWH